MIFQVPTTMASGSRSPTTDPGSSPRDRASTHIWATRHLALAATPRYLPLHRLHEGSTRRHPVIDRPARGELRHHPRAGRTVRAHASSSGRAPHARRGDKDISRARRSPDELTRLIALREVGAAHRLFARIGPAFVVVRARRARGGISRRARVGDGGRRREGDEGEDGATDGSSSSDSLGRLEGELFAEVGREEKRAVDDDAEKRASAGARGEPRVVRRKLNPSSATGNRARSARTRRLCLIFAWCHERKGAGDDASGRAGTRGGESDGLRGHFTTSMRYIFTRTHAFERRGLKGQARGKGQVGKRRRL